MLDRPRNGESSLRRTGIWLSVVGAFFTLVALVAVLVLWDGSGSGVATGDETTAEKTSSGAGSGAGSDIDGTDSDDEPISPSSQSAPPPATPEEVAELLAGLPTELEEQATTGDDRPRELTEDEVDSIVDSLLDQLGAKP